LVSTTSHAFAPSPFAIKHPHRLDVLSLAAKKKNKPASSGQGFGKVEDIPAPPQVKVMETSPSKETAIAPPPPTQSSFLQSVQGGSTQVPKATGGDDLTGEERAKQLLRQKYGMKTLEEDRLDKKQRDELLKTRKKFAELKAKAAADEEFDLISLIPGDVLLGIYAVLKAGIAIVGTAFFLSGLGITAEAWSKASDSPLPDNIDSFIVNIIEPNFTPMLLVLLGFSVTLGILASLQLGSKSATYSEDG
jgi:hypothetical protein